MPKKKSVKKIIKQKQKQSTKINITIDNSKKTTRNTQQKPKNTNRYDSMPTYNILYDNPKPPPPLMQSNKEENKSNPLARSVGSQTYANQNSIETQTEPQRQGESIETQTEPETQIQTAETQTEPKRIKIKISKIKIPSSINFTTPTQENNLMSQVDFDEAISLNRIYDDIPERRKYTPKPFDELNTPNVKEKIEKIENIERLKQISVSENNPLDTKNPVGRPKKKEGDAKGKYTKKSPSTDVKRFESPEVGNRRDTTSL